jgi:hypothetical protein
MLSAASMSGKCQKQTSAIDCARVPTAAPKEDARRARSVIGSHGVGPAKLKEGLAVVTPSLLRFSLVFQVAALLAIGSVLIPTSPARATDDSAVVKKPAVPLDVTKEYKPSDATIDEKPKYPIEVTKCPAVPAPHSECRSRQLFTCKPIRRGECPVEHCRNTGRYCSG